MKSSPSFQFFPNDWLGSTNIMLMTPAQEGAYVHLLAVEWNAVDCSLPDDDEQLAILSRLGEGWYKGGSEAIRKCFMKKNGKLYNSRLLLERKRQAEWRKKSIEGGIKSAKARWGNRLKQKDDDKGAYNKVTDCLQPNGNSSSSSSSSSSIKNKESANSKVLDKSEHLKSPSSPLKDECSAAEFEQFYQAYPNKKGKKNALKSWVKAVNKPALNIMLDRLKEQSKSKQWQEDDGKYIPMPATWLNQERWNDVFEHTRAKWLDSAERKQSPSRQ